MPIDLQLIRDDRVLLRTLTDPLDIGELVASFHYGSREIIEPSPHIIHLIFDLTNLRKLPSNPINFARFVETKLVEKVGRIIFVSQSHFVRRFTLVASQFTINLQPIVVGTLDEALVMVDGWLAEEAGKVAKDDSGDDKSKF